MKKARKVLKKLRYLNLRLIPSGNFSVGSITFILDSILSLIPYKAEISYKDSPSLTT
jgi:hypothetical protein